MSEKMTLVELADMTGKPITSVYIPKTKILPDVLEWGNRYFQLDVLAESDKNVFFEVVGMKVHQQPKKPFKKSAKVDRYLKKLEKSL